MSTASPAFRGKNYRIRILKKSLDHLKKHYPEEKMTNTTLKIKGMHCASCATIISKALLKEKGVKSAHVNFSTEKATVEFDPQQTDEFKLIIVIKNK